MKTIFKKFLVLSIGISIFGCSKDNTPTTPVPTVDFTYSGANLPAPAVINFTSTTSNATTYVWDFGDNSTSTFSNPQHSYTSGGVYTVKLTATGAGGSTSVTKTINIAAALTKVKITKITVTSLTFTKPGGTSGWDPDGSGPDLYFQIQDTNSAVLYDSKNTFSVANNITPTNLPLSWDLATNNVSFDITNIASTRFINFFDSDSPLTPDNMSYVGFLFSNYTTGTSPYPTTVTQTQNGITITLNLTWY